MYLSSLFCLLVLYLDEQIFLVPFTRTINIKKKTTNTHSWVWMLIHIFQNLFIPFFSNILQFSEMLHLPLVCEFACFIIEIHWHFIFWILRGAHFHYTWWIMFCFIWDNTDEILRAYEIWCMYHMCFNSNDERNKYGHSRISIFILR